MSPTKTQAISGVSSGTENTIIVVYPSISASWFGRMLGSLCECIPLGIGTIKLSHVLFGPIVAPIALLLYLWTKAFGTRYVVTNRSVQVWNTLGTRQLTQVNLADIADVEIEVVPGQQFFKAGDLILRAADDRTLARLRGVQRPGVLAQTILKARDARSQVEAALAQIASR